MIIISACCIAKLVTMETYFICFCVSGSGVTEITLMKRNIFRFVCIYNDVQMNSIECSDMVLHYNKLYYDDDDDDGELILLIVVMRL